MAKTLTMYDAATDLIRPVTQEDINLMQRRLGELARFRDRVVRSEPPVIKIELVRANG